MYFRARQYDPATGEFTSRDPQEYVDGMSQYRGYFVPSLIDPEGLRKGSSCRVAVQCGSIPSSFGGIHCGLQITSPFNGSKENIDWTLDGSDDDGNLILGEDDPHWTDLPGYEHVEVDDFEEFDPSVFKRGYHVHYRSIFDVVRDLLHDEAMDGHDRVMSRYLKPDLLIIDDFGMKQLPKRSGEFLFEIVMRRYETRSTMMTSHRRWKIGASCWATSPRPRQSSIASCTTQRSSASEASRTDLATAAPTQNQPLPTKRPTGSRNPKKIQNQPKRPPGPAPKRTNIPAQ